MIFPALAAGVACMLLVGHDLRRHPGHPLAMMRVAISAAWAVAWTTYGLNPAHYPQPGWDALLLAGIGCAASLAMVPSASLADNTDAGDEIRPPFASGSQAEVWFAVLLLASALLVAWDLSHILQNVGKYGLADGVVLHRVDRGSRTGAYRFPGAEGAHVLAALTGALGYALWVARRSRLGAVAAGLGLVTMLTSTGRWDVVGFSLWCMAIEAALNRTRSNRQIGWAEVRLFVLLGVFFLFHGQLFRKNDALEALAAVRSPEERLAAVNVPAALGIKTVLPPSKGEACPRWEAGTRAANESFRRMGRAERVLVTYFSGPLAALDRAVCEGRQASRPVIFYWPNKIGRLAGLPLPQPSATVDPFLDVGLPFNNYTVIYPFWSEFGPLAGPLVWVAAALLVRLFVRWALAHRESVAWAVAGTAPVSIAVRTPWANAFFDGSLVVWVAVPVLAWMLHRVALRSRRSPPVPVRER